MEFSLVTGGRLGGFRKKYKAKIQFVLRLRPEESCNQSNKDSNLLSVSLLLSKYSLANAGLVCWSDFE